MEPCDVLNKYATELLALPVRVPQFIALLNKRSLLPGDIQDKLKAIHRTDAEAAQLFVSEIDKTLVISRVSFDKLISAMKEYDDDNIKKLAIKMECDAPNPAGMYVHMPFTYSM